MIVVMVMAWRFIGMIIMIMMTIVTMTTMVWWFIVLPFNRPIQG